MIQSFKDKDTRRFFEGERVARFEGFARQGTRRLTMLERARSIRELAMMPSNRVKALKGDRKGQHSIRINQQWRICFRWTPSGPCDVEFVDYH